MKTILLSRSWEVIILNGKLPFLLLGTMHSLFFLVFSLEVFLDDVTALAPLERALTPPGGQSKKDPLKKILK